MSTVVPDFGNLSRQFSKLAQTMSWKAARNWAQDWAEISTFGGINSAQQDATVSAMSLPWGLSPWPSQMMTKF